MTAFTDNLDHVLDLPAAPYTLPTSGPIGGGRAVFSVSVARQARPVAHTFEHWCEEAGRLQVDLPAFNWQAIADFRPDHPIVLIHTGSSVQALMQLRETHSVPCPLGVRGPQTYISLLEVAPWNRNDAASRRYRGLGQLMLRFACQRSRQLGHDGRIGLHALGSAEGFYDRLGFSAPLCPNEYHEMCFELPPEAALALIAEEV
ncbi:MAG: hypothetical protein ACKVP7_08490 [Hyphomicrobiaceae bacterium]